MTRRFVVREFTWIGSSHAPEQIDVNVLDSQDCYRRLAGWTSHAMSRRDRRQLGPDGVREALRNRAHGYAAILEHELNP